MGLNGSPAGAGLVAGTTLAVHAAVSGAVGCRPVNVCTRVLTLVVLLTRRHPPSEAVVTGLTVHIHPETSLDPAPGHTGSH